MGIARSQSRASPASGFTLIELLVSVSVLAIILALAIPSFEGVFNSSRLANAANEIVASLQSARMEAVRRNARVGMCLTPDPDAAIPDCDVDDAAGTVVYLDADGNGAVGAATDVLRRASVAGAVLLSSSGALDGNVAFSSDGLAYDEGILASGTLRVCIPTSAPAENMRDVTLAAGSRVRIDPANGGGACAAP